MNRTLFDTPVITPILRILFKIYLGVLGWQTSGTVPSEPKCVVIAAPHTSSWDLTFLLACGFILRVRANWMGKKSLFKFPFGFLLKWLGGIPVDRSKRTNVIEQAVQTIAVSDHILMAIAAEGTRKRVTKWKSGFYYIALQANVPISMGFVDYKRKLVGFGPTFFPSGSLKDDMGLVADFYKDITAKYPERFSVPDLSVLE